MVMFSYFLMTLLGFSGLFLIGLILLQRGRGGGLAGAFGGIGGQSAFGTKAGDVFTRITIGVASAWILLCAGSVVALHNSTAQRTSPGVFADPAVLKAEDAKAEAEAEKALRDQAGSNSIDDSQLKLEDDGSQDPGTKVDPGVKVDEAKKPDESTKEDSASIKTDGAAPESDKKPEEPKQ